jgi:hypothetical protein
MGWFKNQSWRDASGELPQRTYPIQLLIRSILKVEQDRLAAKAKKIIEANDASCTVVLVDQ